MDSTTQPIRVLLVDDEDVFRQGTARLLKRRGFEVSEAESGFKAVEAVHLSPPDVVILDLRMEGIDGITTLQEIRKIQPELPVIILTGHGQYHDAMASIRLAVVDFLQKPVEIEHLVARIRHAHTRGQLEPLREKTISELMAPVSSYTRLYLDQPVADAVEALKTIFFVPNWTSEVAPERLRSALVYDRQERFVGILRFPDLLKLVLPPFFTSLPYASYFTGMFLAQCKLIGKCRISDLLEEPVSIAEDAPLIEAVHLMVMHHLINLPVMRGEELVGVLRERDVILEIAERMGV